VCLVSVLVLLKGIQAVLRNVRFPCSFPSSSSFHTCNISSSFKLPQTSKPSSPSPGYSSANHLHPLTHRDVEELISHPLGSHIAFSPTRQRPTRRGLQQYYFQKSNMIHTHSRKTGLGIAHGRSIESHELYCKHANAAHSASARSRTGPRIRVQGVVLHER
jgi:hypothetical protein